MANPLVENIMLFKRLSQYPAEHVYRAVKDESPQVIAVVLARLDSKKAKEILGNFTSEDQQDIVYRMATTKSIPPDLLNEVANTIGGKLRYLDAGSEQIPLEGQEKIAEIMKHMGTGKSKDLLDALGKKDRNLADRVNRKLFTFDDIANTELKGLQQSLQPVDTGVLALALKGAGDEVKAAVWNALSANRRKMLKSEMKYLGPQRRSDVERARIELMAELRGFYDQGILKLQSDPSDDEWV